MDIRKKEESIARAEDLRNLLDHIAWTDTIQPELDKLSTHYEALLVKSVLGEKLVVATPAGPTVISSEQLAGRIQGIAFIKDLFDKILRNGVAAFKDLNNISS